MKEFSLLEFASFLGTLSLETERANHQALEHAAVIVETEAKRVIGTYDYGWPPLAASTLAKKSADTPLLETGELRVSIEHQSTAHEAAIGSDDDKALWHELGTRTIPARSFLASAAMHKEAEVMQLIGRQTVMALSGSALPLPKSIP